MSKARTTTKSFDALIARTEERIREIQQSPKEGNSRLLYNLINSVRKYRRQRLKIAKRKK
jgi:hypothetical protein